MATKVNPELIKQMNELYYQLHTYAAVAREVGVSAGTVSKYVDKNWRPVDKTAIKHISLNDLPDPAEAIKIFRGVDNFGTLCVLSDNEYAEIKELWGELEQ